ncbi:MAG TPA: CpaF family protein [Actinomycetota bacterium]|nr:CpaF family protein [Actinomycetota bacterium]
MSLSERAERAEREAAHTIGSKSPRTKTQRAVAPAAKEAAEWGQMKRRVREVLLEELGPKLSARIKSEELSSLVSSHLDEALRTAEVSLPSSKRAQFVREVAADLLGYGPLEPLLADKEVTEIMCNQIDEIYVERRGKIERTTASFMDEGQFRQVIEKIVAQVGRRIDESSPMVDARLPDGSRVNAVIPPVAIHGPILTIRRFPEKAFEVKDLIAFGSITVDTAVFLEACVRAKLNVLVTGGTGTGKTTVLNVISGFIPLDERVITIEDAAELRLNQPHVVSLEARPANIEGAGEIKIRDLLRNALRMRPDRIIVGEVRGAEALDMLQAMNTGHEGSLTTLHCNSPRDALSRLETLVLMAGFDLPVRAIRNQIAAAIDIIVHLDRFGDGSRRCTAITEVQGMESDIITIQDVFHFVYTQGGKESSRVAGRLQATGLRPKIIERIRTAGLDLPPKLFQPGGLTPAAAPRPENWGLTPVGPAQPEPAPADARAELLASLARQRGGHR